MTKKDKIHIAFVSFCMAAALVSPILPGSDSKTSRRELAPLPAVYTPETARDLWFSYFRYGV